uniref:Stabilin 1 n=1 Tax=Anolis carolinensis TaxID=28377 RepID=A0A803TKA8_ANOCA
TIFTRGLSHWLPLFKFTQQVPCTSCALVDKVRCPRGWLRSAPYKEKCRYTVKLAENTLSLEGCTQTCTKEIEEKHCCAGYWGFECYECPGGAQNVCSGHGVCLDDMAQNGTCICKENYGGYACQECKDENHFGPDCQSVCECQHGICSHGPSGDGSCTCFAGYTGPKCDQELLVCGSVICEDNSLCVVKDGQARCECMPGYMKSGTHCQAQDPCRTSPCSSQAVCKSLGPTKYGCTCQEGYQGDGRVCQAINPCLFNNGGCPENSTICRFESPGKVSYAQNLCKMHIVPGQHLWNDMTKIKELWTLSGHKITFMMVPIFYFIFLQNCGLPSILDGPGPFTVFVPSNEAVDKLRDGRLIYLFTEVRLFPLLISNNVQVERLIAMPQILTMANQILKIRISEDGRILLGDSEVAMKKRDILASNGVIHILDGIFIPPSIVPILPHRCNEQTYKIIAGSCVDCDALNTSVCPPVSQAHGIFPKDHEDCVYIHDPLGLNMLKKGCSKKCNQTITTPGCCKGFFGLSCNPCPGGFTNPCYGRGTCSDGIRGTGQCLCSKAFKGVACHICTNPNKHGENCDEDCSCVHGICDNRPGSQGVCQVGTCKAGYTGQLCDRSNQTCGSSGASLSCHLNAVCTLEGTASARCICVDGYEGDGISCKPIDACSKPERGGCSENAVCTSTGPGTATCQCNRGWTGDGKGCVAIDNCVLETRGGCHINADCNYIGPGQSSCMCKRGYEGDGYSCDPVEPCSTNNGGCHELAVCQTLSTGEKACRCSEGYMGDGVLCYGDVMKVKRLAFKSLFSIPEGGNVTVLVPQKEAIQNLSVAEKDFWLKPDTLSSLVRSHFLQGSLTTEELQNYVGKEIATLNPRAKWMINNSSGDNDTVQYHVILGDKLLPENLKSGVHKSTMLGMSYWLMFYKNNTEVGMTYVSFVYCMIKRATQMVIEDRHHFSSDDVSISNHETSSWTVRSICVSVCCPGYYGHMCEMCPGEPGHWCSGNGLCQDGLDGNGECQCQEGYHGTACEMCQPGRYGANCTLECSCKHGKCKDGLLGDGSCVCNPGFQGTQCDQGRIHALLCARGFIFDFNFFLLYFSCIKDSAVSQPTCFCSAGYTGNGTYCTEIDPCAVGNGGCSPHASCNKVGPGERTCTCQDGYAGDGTVCRGEHHAVCDRKGGGDNGGCSPLAYCLETHYGSRICMCMQGEGDGITCRRSIWKFSEWEKKGAIQDLLRYHMVGCQQLQSSDLESQNSITALSGHKIKISVKEVCAAIAPILVSYSTSEKYVVLCAPAHLFSVSVQETGLLNEVNNIFHQPFTMLWPTDAAFNSLPTEMKMWLYHKEHQSKLVAYLKGHMIRDRKMLASTITGSTFLRTLHGSTISFSCSRTDLGDILVDNSNAKIVQRYIQFDVGIAYGIDKLLEPPDLGARCDAFHTSEVSGETQSCLYTENILSSGIESSHYKYQTYRWRPARRNVVKGCKRTCFAIKWAPRCCANHYGRDCQVCPGGLEAPCNNRGTCDDGQMGTGHCNCSAAFIGTACEHCSPGRYGPECKECNCTENGICNEGLHGDGFCFCSAGWIGERCEIELAAMPQCSPTCHANAVCRANNTCECKLYYEGDGITCSVIDQCGEDNGGCSDYANCTQIGIDVSCSCLSDYEGDGYVCSPIDKCADGNNGDCSEHATCISTGPNSRRCECKSGYVGNGVQCLEEATPPIDRCLEENGQCHAEAVCTDLHFQDKTVGVFHLQSPKGKYSFTYQDAEASCGAEGATVATLQQLSAAQQMGFHLCIVGWLHNRTAGYPTVYPSKKCGGHRVGIVSYGYRNNISEQWDAYCYRAQDVRCSCKEGFIGDGYTCIGNVLTVLGQFANFSLYYNLLLDHANSTQDGADFLDFLSTDTTYKTLFIPLNSGFKENMVRSKTPDIIIKNNENIVLLRRVKSRRNVVVLIFITFSYGNLGIIVLEQWLSTCRSPDVLAFNSQKS